MLGVVIGTASIVLVVTIALTGQRYILAQIEGVGANLVYAHLVATGEGGTTVFADRITPADRAAVQQGLPELVTETAGSNWLSMTMDVGGRERMINLVGVTDGFQQIRNLEVLRGRYFDQDDLASGSKVCLLTEALARRDRPDRRSGGPRHSGGRTSFHRDRSLSRARGHAWRVGNHH